NDFLSLTIIEMAHVLGLVNDMNSLFIQDPAHFLTNTGVADQVNSPGTLWTYNAPNVKALFTTDNAGVTDTGLPVHVVQSGLSTMITVNGITYFGAEDSDNAGGYGNARYLPSNLDALVLHDSYGYTINSPTQRSHYINFDPTTGKLLLRGGQPGLNVYP